MIREELILQYLNNQASTADIKLVESWKKENPEDFALMEEIWSESSSVKEIELFNVETEWDNFMAMVATAEDSTEQSQNRSETKTIQLVPEQDEGLEQDKPVSLWREWRPFAVAASLLAITAISYFLWPRGDIQHMALVDQDKITLPDQTIVTINEGSTVTYPRSFENKEKRIVGLDGIATFDVFSNPDQPFVVEVNGTGIKALGTIFEIDATDSVSTGVKNIEGLIRFFELENVDNFVTIEEGQSFIYDGSGFSETTPREPVVKEFVPPPPPPRVIPLHTVREIVNYMRLISNGHVVPKGDDFDWNKKIRIDLQTENLSKLIREVQRKASLTLVKKDCGDCYELRRFKVR